MLASNYSMYVVSRMSFWVISLSVQLVDVNAFLAETVN